MRYNTFENNEEEEKNADFFYIFKKEGADDASDGAGKGISGSPL